MLDVLRGVRSGVIRSVVGGILVNLGLVMMITLGNLSTYVTSYIKYVNGDVTIQNEDIGWVMVFGMVSGGLGTFLCAMVERSLKTRKSTFLGCCIHVSGIMLSYFSIQRSFSLFVVTYGVLAAAGTEIAWGASVQNAIQWVPAYPSTASGVVGGACGFGAVFFDMVMTAFINPENLPPDVTADDGNTYFTDEKLLARVPYVFLLLGTIYGALQTVGVLLMLDADDEELSSIKEDMEYILPKADHVSEQKHHEEEAIALQTTVGQNDHYGATVGQTDQYGATVGQNDQYGATVGQTDQYGATVGQIYDHYVDTETTEEKQDIGIIEKTCQNDKARNSGGDGLLTVIFYMLKKGDTYVVWFYCILFEVGMMFVLNHYKVYGQTFIADDVFLASVGSVGGFSEVFMRPLWGILMDRCGLEVAMKVIAAINSVLLGTLALTEYMGKAAFFIWIFGLFACTTSVGVLTTGGMVKIFGTKNVIITFAIFNIAKIVSTFVSVQTTLLLRDVIGWHGVFLMFVSLNTIGFFITFLLHGKDEEGNTF